MSRYAKLGTHVTCKYSMPHQSAAMAVSHIRAAMLLVCKQSTHGQVLSQQGNGVRIEHCYIIVHLSPQALASGVNPNLATRPVSERVTLCQYTVNNC